MKIGEIELALKYEGILRDRKLQQAIKNPLKVARVLPVQKA